MGQEEICAQQHVEACRIDFAETESRILDLLIADFETGDRCNVGGVTAFTDATAMAGMDHARGGDGYAGRGGALG